jgi:hypothetical protein
MANPWFRLYSEFADDPKVQMMSEGMQRRLTMLMCSRCKGETLRETEMAFHWRISAGELADTKAVFLENGFIDEKWNLLNWNRRQFISDSSTERVRRFREGKKQDETLQTPNVTAPEQNRTDSEQTQKQKKPSVAVATFTLPPWVEVDAWNAYDEMRKKIRKPMSDHARDLILKKLEGFEARGMSSTDALNASTENCWTGVFEPKSQNGGNTRAKPSRIDAILESTNATLALRRNRGLDGESDSDGGGANPVTTARSLFERPHAQLVAKNPG